MKLFTGVRIIFSSLLLASLVLGMQGCGGGGGGSTPAPVVNTSLASAARGFYEGLGTIEVAGGDLVLGSPNIKAIIDEKQFVIVNRGADNLLYKGTFTEVTATTFKANIRVYRAGNFIATAEITNGTIVAGTSFNGTITATGVYAGLDYASSVGDIDLTYSTANALTPPVYTFGSANSWQDSMPEANVRFNSLTTIDLSFNANPVVVTTCVATNFGTTDVVNEQTGRIRSFTTSPLTTCANISNGITLSGYFTNFNVGAQDDTMLIVASDDNSAYVGILSCRDTTAPGLCFD